MFGFVLRRVLIAVPVLLGVSLITFLVLYLIPGDPAQALLYGTGASAADVAALRHQLGLDQPLPEQYLRYVLGLLHGDLGQSYANHDSVADLIGSRLASTFALAAGAMAVALLVGVPAGVLAGRHPGGLVDRLVMSLAVLGTAIPYFWLALVLVAVLSVSLGWFPAIDDGSFAALVLPAVALGWGFAALLARLLRSGLVSAYSQPYVLAARARGLAERRILLTTVLRNACGPMVAVLGIQIGQMLAGAVAIEVIFGRAGLGSLLYDAITHKDIPTIQGGVLFIAAVYVVLNLLVDLAKVAIDPRTARGSIL